MELWLVPSVLPGSLGSLCKLRRLRDSLTDCCFATAFTLAFGELFDAVFLPMAVSSNQKENNLINKDFEVWKSRMIQVSQQTNQLRTLQSMINSPVCDKQSIEQYRKLTKHDPRMLRYMIGLLMLSNKL